MDEQDNQHWTLQDIYDDLGSKTDCAADLDVTIHRMNNWIQRRERIKSPHPVMKLSNAWVYSKQEWRAWFERWRNEPRRAKWMESNRPHGAGLPFFAYAGPDRGWPAKIMLHIRQSELEQRLEQHQRETYGTADAPDDGGCDDVPGLALDAGTDEVAEGPGRDTE